jgi:hypothetical protein
MDHQTFVERILENENLTGDLEDGPASQLLQWGTSQVRAVVQGLEDEEAAGVKVKALMALMRQVNRTAGTSAGSAAEDLAADLERLLEHHARAFEQARRASAAEIEAAAATLGAMSPDQAVPFLLEWLNAREG